MRVDVRIDKNWKRGTVFVDSVEVKDCVAFDDVEGWAEVYLRNEKGGFAKTPDGKIAHKRLHGSIRFEAYKED